MLVGCGGPEQLIDTQTSSQSVRVAMHNALQAAAASQDNPRPVLHLTIYDVCMSRAAWGLADLFGPALESVAYSE